MTESIRNKFEGLKNVISNTPLLDIKYKYCGKERHIYAKYEAFNLTGSLKDRVAYHILYNAYEKGLIKPDDIIAEATSGNTGISFSAIGSYLGHKVIIYMPDWMSKERISLMESYGAEVRLVSREEGGFLGSIDLCEKLKEKGGVFLPYQFSNEENVNTHIIYTGEEFINQLAKIGVVPESVVAGVGTGGTVMGLGLKFRQHNPDCTIHPLEPLSSPTLSTGFKVGSHRIQGISDEFIPPILKLSELNEIVSVDDSDSIIMARMLSSALGLGVGVSSGANFIGACMVQNLYGDDRCVATIFPDDSKKYLSTDYALKQIPSENSILGNIELISFSSVR